MKVHAFRVYEPGDASVLRWEQIDLPGPERGEVLVRHTAVGFNMVDTYMRSGLYYRGAMPIGLGIEAAGVIEALGPGVAHVKVGDRVAYSGGPPGTYAEARVIPAASAIKLPVWLDDRIAAAALTKGCTVEYLFTRTHKLKKGETILFHAAAGGVGLIACQWARAIGASVIGTVGTEEKARLAKRNGCRYPIVYTARDWPGEVMKITKGAGVDVVYDSVGKDTWEGSLECLKLRGLLVSFGSASGHPRPFDLAVEGIRKSIFVTRATTQNYMTGPEAQHASARALFRRMRDGTLKIRIGQTYALKDAPRVHEDAEARRTTGSTVMIP